MLKIWENHTGSCPLSVTLQQLFKQAMLKGQVQDVKQNMYRMVASYDMPLDQWMAALVHQLDIDDKNMEQLSSDIQNLKQQLVAEQLQQLRDNQSKRRRKKKNVAKAQMVMAPTPVFGSDQFVGSLPPEVPFQMYQSPPWGQIPSRDTQQYRNHRKGPTKGYDVPLCWTCGYPGHFERSCPNRR
jgi:hypothetical protein